MIEVTKSNDIRVVFYALFKRFSVADIVYFPILEVEEAIHLRHIENDIILGVIQQTYENIVEEPTLSNTRVPKCDDATSRDKT